MAKNMLESWTISPQAEVTIQGTVVAGIFLEDKAVSQNFEGKTDDGPFRSGGDLCVFDSWIWISSCPTKTIDFLFVKETGQFIAKG